MIAATKAYGPVPLVVATTGHRDLHPDQTSRVEAAVRAFLKGLRDTYPHTQIQVLSALAEGADRLVARIALELELTLVVPLPKPLDEYEKDFKTAPSRKELGALLASAARTLVVPDSGGTSDDAYARLGVWLARHSHIVLALWDCVENNKPGGTGDVVRLKREGVPDDAAGRQQPLDPADTGPVHVIRVRRAGAPADERVGEVLPDPAEDTFARICQRTDELNQDAIRYERKLADARRASRNDLVFGLSSGVAPAEATVDLYAHADALAVLFQTRTRYALTALFWAAFVTVVFFSLFAHAEGGLEEHELALLVTYLLLFFLASLFYAFVEKHRFQSRYLDYRALAEGLRVQFYWRVAGIADSAAGRYLSQQRDELDWIRSALRTCELAMEGQAALTTREGLWHALTSWVAKQAGFFESRIRDEGAKRHRIAWIVRALAAFGVLVTGAYGEVLAFGYRPAASWRALAIILIALSAAAAALWHGYSEKRAYGSHVKRYSRIGALFARAKTRLAGHLERGEDAAARNVLHDLGCRALEENGDWVMLHRDRPLEVPQAG